MEDESITDNVLDKSNQIEKRAVFKWLPVLFENDLVHGSYWYYWGSLLAVFIPVIPLIALYENWWPPATDAEGNELLPGTPHTTAYALMTYAGVWYVIGSYIFINIFRKNYEERNHLHVNILSCQHVLFHNDELIAIWCFIIGTVPYIPVLVLYVYYNHSFEFKLALAAVIFAVFGMLIFVLVVAPEREDTCIVKTLKLFDPCLRIIRGKYPSDPKRVIVQIFVPCFEFCCFCMEKEIATDVLIVCWVILVGCFFCMLAMFVLLIRSIYNNSSFGIYNYTICFVDMIFFFIGSLYFVAGFQEKVNDQIDINKSSSSANRSISNFEQRHVAISSNTTLLNEAIDDIENVEHKSVVTLPESESVSVPVLAFTMSERTPMSNRNIDSSVEFAAKENENHTLTLMTLNDADFTDMFTKTSGTNAINTYTNTDVCKSQVTDALTYDKLEKSAALSMLLLRQDTIPGIADAKSSGSLSWSHGAADYSSGRGTAAPAVGGLDELKRYSSKLLTDSKSTAIYSVSVPNIAVVESASQPKSTHIHTAVKCYKTSEAKNCNNDNVSNTNSAFGCATDFELSSINDCTSSISSSASVTHLAVTVNKPQPQISVPIISSSRKQSTVVPI